MGRSQETYNKKEVRKRKEKKRKDKAAKKLERKDNEGGSSLDDMIAYVDEYGNFTDTPPDPADKDEIKVEDILITPPKRDNVAEDPNRTGTVSFFNDSKGYGFIKDSITKDGVFVHINNCIDDIKEGNLVTFEVEKGHKGLAAVNVKISK
jgi:cold shock CspA family protein